MFHVRIPSIASLVLSVLILPGIGYTPAVQASDGLGKCTLKSAKGEFGTILTGAITAGPFAGPYAAVLRITCDGKGSCQGRGTQSLNGTIIPLDAPGSYTVNPDCTGSITVTPPGVPDMHFDFIIVNNGEEIRSIITDPGSVIIGNLRQQ